MSAPMEPLPPDVVDELLSAELDGEFDEAARELGFEPDIARARLDATAGSGARRHQLEFAQRASASASGPGLSDAQRQSLVDTALATTAPVDELARRRRRTRLYTTVAGIAAALLVVVGIGTMLGDNTGGNSDDSAAPVAADSAGEAEASSQLAGQSLGDVSEPDLLRREVRDALRVPSADSDATPGAGESFDANDDDSATTSFRSQAGATVAPAPRCEDSLRDQLQLGELVLIAPATYRGREVRVYVFDRSDGHYAVVVDDTCDLVASQLVR